MKIIAYANKFEYPDEWLLVRYEVTKQTQEKVSLNNNHKMSGKKCQTSANKMRTKPRWFYQ